MDEILFEVKKGNLETGLRGYPVGYCTTSHVDPIAGLFYSGKKVESLIEKEPVEVIYLLYYGKEGTQEEIEKFKQDLIQRSSCDSKTLAAIRQLPRSGDPMKLFAAAILIAGMYEGTGDYKQDCLNLIAKAPILTAHCINHHAGWESNTKTLESTQGYIENFTALLNLKGVDQTVLNKCFKLFNILHYDHGGGNLSTFVGKAVASGLEDMYGAIAAAMCALAGPKHGRASQDCLEFNQKILAQLNGEITEEKVKALLMDSLENKQLLYGFGHAVLRVEDPRASVIYKQLKNQCPEHPLVKLGFILRKIGPEVLKLNPKISDPFPNIDSISGTFLLTSGFPYPEYFTLLFGLARIVGIAIQIVYERCIARDGKGTPLIRPKYIYKPRIL